MNEEEDGSGGDGGGHDDAYEAPVSANQQNGRTSLMPNRMTTQWSNSSLQEVAEESEVTEFPVGEDARCTDTAQRSFPHCTAVLLTHEDAHCTAALLTHERVCEWSLCLSMKL